MMNAAYFHITLVHIPVILCPLGAMLLAVAHLRHSIDIARVALALLGISGIMVVPVFLLGEPTEAIMRRIPGVSALLIEVHEESAHVALWLTASSGALSLITWLAITVGAALERALLALTFFVATLAGTALVYTAHMGGAIRHPEAFMEILTDAD